MRRRFVILAFLTLPGLWAASQQRRHFSKEITIITDNDNYLVQKRDGYYTNGFYLSFQHLPQKQRTNQKAIMRT